MLQFFVLGGVIFHLVWGVILYFWPDIFLFLGKPLVATSLMFLMGFIRWMQNDFIIQLRLAFLTAIGTASAVAKLISPDMVLLDFGREIQTYEVMIKMYALTLIGVGSSVVGYMVARGMPVRYTAFTIVDKAIATDRVLYVISLLVIVLVGYLSSLSYGPPVWEATYASGQGQGQLLGNLQSIGVIFVGINFLIAQRLNNKNILLLSLSGCFYFLVFGILVRGGRLEFLSGMLALYICFYVIRGLPAGMKLRNYGWLILAALSMEYFGYLRYALAGVEAEAFLDGFWKMYDNEVLFLGTISGIGSSYANVIEMLEVGILDFSFGWHYLEYIFRTPPQFLYPDRPEDLSSIFETYGYLSIGGFFELAEAFLNFGIWGVLIIPAIITFYFKRVLDKAVSGSFLNYILLLAIVSVFMRGAWYQTFAYYKAIVTGLIIYALILVYRGVRQELVVAR